MRKISLALTCLLALAIAGVASAQIIKDETVNEAMTGEITSIDPDVQMITVKGANGEQGVFAIDPKTTIMNGDKMVKLSDLKVGWRIAVDADTKDDIDRATYIEVVEAP